MVRTEGLVPEGLVEGCRLKRPIAKDQPIHWSDVEAPSQELAHQLYAEQQRRWGSV